jgi:two-component system, NarL family, sensor histidine kinase DegS
MSGPYTPKPMEAARGATDARDSRFDGLHAEASAAVGYSANTIRQVREQYREAYAEALSHWQELRDELDGIDRTPHLDRPRLLRDDPGEAQESADAPGSAEAAALSAAEAGAGDARQRALRTEVEVLAGALERHRSTLAKLELAERTLSRTWLFLERGDSTLVAPDDTPGASGDVAMRIVEAQEAERARLAQEIHDGPAQAFTNAIFQAEYAERISATDPAATTAEIRALRDLLRRELSNLRGYIGQLRPPLLDELGLAGAIEEAAGDLRSTTGLIVTTDLRAPNDSLGDHQQTVALRVTQEALQNVRKHAAASTVVVSTDVADDAWALEIRDDGRGFDVGAVAARGRRNFGLQFMRERAELIDARFDVRSRPDGGTVVRLAIPTGARTGVKENG